MMRPEATRALLLFCFFAAALLVGCLNFQTRPTREYLLSWQGDIPEDFQAGTSMAPRGASIAIGPIVVPSYLQRAGIVTRTGENRITASTVHTWAEPLEAGIARMLVEGLVWKTGSNQLSGMPWPFPGAPDLRVAVELLVFEYDHTSGSISLIARWTVLEGRRGRAQLVHRAILEHTIDGADFPSIVDGMSQIVLDLSDRIAVDIEGLQ